MKKCKLLLTSLLLMPYKLLYFIWLIIKHTFINFFTAINKAIKEEIIYKENYNKLIILLICITIYFYCIPEFITYIFSIKEIFTEEIIPAYKEKFHTNTTTQEEEINYNIKVIEEKEKENNNYNKIITPNTTIITEEEIKEAEAKVKEEALAYLKEKEQEKIAMEDTEQDITYTNYANAIYNLKNLIQGNNNTLYGGAICKEKNKEYWQFIAYNSITDTHPRVNLLINYILNNAFPICKRKKTGLYNTLIIKNKPNLTGISNILAEKLNLPQVTIEEL